MSVTSGAETLQAVSTWNMRMILARCTWETRGLTESHLQQHSNRKLTERRVVLVCLVASWASALVLALILIACSAGGVKFPRAIFPIASKSLVHPFIVLLIVRADVPVVR